MPPLNGSTQVGGVWYGPEDKLTEAMAAQIGEHAFEGGVHPYPAARERFVAQRDGTPVQEPPDDEVGGSRKPGEEPPRKGKGSGKEAWQAFAGEKGFALDGDPGRDEIIELMVDAELIKAEQ